MSNSETTQFHSTQEMIDALRCARDEAHLRFHLFSMDARERWDALEARLSLLEAKLQDDLKAGPGSGIQPAGKRVDELVRTTRELLREEHLKHPAEMSTPDWSKQTAP